MSRFGHTPGSYTGSNYGALNQYEAFKILKENLPVFYEETVFMRMGQSKQEQLVAKPKAGADVGFNRWEKLSNVTTPIPEGVTPQFSNMQKTVIRATLSLYGDWVPYTDMLESLSPDNVIEVTTKRQFEQAAQTFEALIYAVVVAGTSVSYCRSTGSAARTSVNRSISDQKGITATSPGVASDRWLSLAERTLRRNTTAEVKEFMAPSAKYSTQGIKKAYIGVVHPDVELDLARCPGWLPVERYSNSGDIMPNEIGMVGRIRFLTSTNCAAIASSGAAVSTDKFISTDTVSNNVYPVIIFGSDAYATVKLQGFNSIVPMVVYPKPGPGDPLGQRGSIGWKSWFTSKITQDLNMTRVECAVSSGDN